MVSLITKEVPEGFFEYCVLELKRIYDEVFRIAHESLKLSQSQAKWGIPYLKRMMAETSAKKIAKAFGLKFTDKKNSKGTWGGNCPQVEIEVGPFIFVFHAVDGPNRKVRPSKRRNTLAMRQKSLFLPQELHPDLEEGKIGVAILHGSDSRRPGELYENLSRVGFATLKFLSPELDYQYQPIDLIEHYNLELYPQAPAESSEDMAHPELRKDIKTKKK